MDNRLPSKRPNAIGDRIVEMEADCKGVGTTLSRQVARSPIQAGGHDSGVNSKTAEGASFPNYYRAAPIPRERPGGAFISVVAKYCSGRHPILCSILNAPVCACNSTIIGKDA